MDGWGWTVQLLNGWAGASSLFLVAAGLSLIFGVTRIVNFAHGSFFLLGIYLAYSGVEFISRPLGLAWGYALAVPMAALVTGALGALVEVLLLRRIYRAPELFQLLATFALVLVIQDGVLWAWGPEDLLAPRVPGLAGSVDVLGRRFPSYDILLIVAGPAVLAGLWWLLHRTRWGLLVRAATQDREMVSALGVVQGRLFTGVFALGCALAGLGGALQLPREPASLGLDMQTMGEAFVVVVVGGMGSIPGAYVAALLIAEIKALCIAIGVVEWGGMSLSFSKLTLVAEFVVMAVVLVLRPWGLFGRSPAVTRAVTFPEMPLRDADVLARRTVWVAVLLAAVPLMSHVFPYVLVLGIDVLVAVLFACSLHLILGPAGLHSFGHAAYFGLGAYAAALGVLRWGWSMEAMLVMAPLITMVVAAGLAWFCVRLSGVYLAMLTLAFGQILWAIGFQWDAVTGGSNGLTGVWPSAWLSDRAAYYGLTLCLVTLGVLVAQRLLHAPLGYSLRAARDSALRARALGLPVERVQWTGLVAAAGLAGVAGSLYAFSKGSIAPDVLGVSRSVDALVMVLLGGVQSLGGPLLGAPVFTVLQDTLARSTEYWRALLGGVMLVLVLAMPQGLAGWLRGRFGRTPRTDENTPGGLT
jgi:branched-chain amino acid transport system permease protein